MRALGPGSVSSFLKIILDVVFFALWIGIGAVGLMMLAASIGSSIEVRASGPEAEAAIEAISALVNDRFGEGE